jgi:hypothetical protein
VAVDRNGYAREPSEVTAADAPGQLERARRAALAADVLLDPSAPVCLANRGAGDVEFSRALVGAFGKTGFARSPEAAAEVLRNTAAKLRG